MPRASDDLVVTEQHRKDSARVLHTMVPGLPPPLINLCLDFCFGPCASGGSGSSSSRASSGRGSFTSALSSSSVKAGRTKSALTGVERSMRPFVLRRMDSGPLGQHSITRPSGFMRRDKHGFSQAESLTFAIQMD